MKNTNVDIKILATQLSIDDCYDFVLNEGCGGLCLFVGTVRNHNKGEVVTHLDFEAYEAMAIKEMEKIAKKALAMHGVNRICIHHRTGTVGIKEKAVIIAVSSVHRKAAFEACEFAIDALKENVPIWKKEFLLDGSHWVNARP